MACANGRVFLVEHAFDPSGEISKTGHTWIEVDPSALNGEDLDTVEPVRTPSKKIIIVAQNLIHVYI